MPNKLVNIKIDEVSLVDKAANKKKFLVIKRADDTLVGGEVIDEVNELLKAGRKISQNNLNRLKELHGQLGGMIEEHSVSEKGDPEAAPEKPEEEKEKGQLSKGEMDKMDENIKKMLDEQAAELAKFKKAAEDAEAERTALAKRLQDAEDLAKAEREERLRKEYIAKAQQFTAMGVKPDDFGAVLKSFAEKDPESYAKMEAVLKAANEAIVKGALFDEIGRDGSQTADVQKQIDAKATELQKADTKLTKAQAVAKVLQQNPELYSAHLSAMKGE